MKRFVGRQLWEYPEGAKELFNHWTKRPTVDATKEILAVMNVVIVEGNDDGHHGAAIYSEGDLRHAARAARALARLMWRKNPMLVMAFTDEITNMVADEFADMIQEWAKRKGLVKPDEGDDGPHALDDEIAYGIYVAARKQGTSHATLLEIDPSNARHLARYEKEYNAGN